MDEAEGLSEENRATFENVIGPPEQAWRDDYDPMDNGGWVSWSALNRLLSAARQEGSANEALMAQISPTMDAYRESRSTPDREGVARLIAYELGVDFEALPPGMHFQEGFCQGDFYRAADALARPASSAGGVEEARADSAWGGVLTTLIRTFRDASERPTNIIDPPFSCVTVNLTPSTWGAAADFLAALTSKGADRG